MSKIKYRIEFLGESGTRSVTVNAKSHQEARHKAEYEVGDGESVHFICRCENKRKKERASRDWRDLLEDEDDCLDYAGLNTLNF